MPLINSDEFISISLLVAACFCSRAEDKNLQKLPRRL